MNILKFKDQIIPNDDVFNNLFKGKYCYCVNWKWCITLEDNSEADYIKMSQSNNVFAYVTYILYEDYKSYVDVIETMRANEVAHFKYVNETVSSELTLDMIKRFRTMVAETLMGCISAWDDEYDIANTSKITSMLEYYVHNMSDCAIRALTEYADPSVNLNGTYTDCGCGSKSTSLSIGAGNQMNMLSSFNKTCNCGVDAVAALFASAGCDCVSLYRKAIYNYMVSVFSDYKFWKLIPSQILNMYINYIDAIIKAGLPLNVSTLNMSSLLYGDCSCLSQDSQSGNILILNNLKKAFQYIIDNQIVEHKNFIFETLYAWSAKLYEVMQW